MFLSTVCLLPYEPMNGCLALSVYALCLFVSVCPMFCASAIIHCPTKEGFRCFQNLIYTAAFECPHIEYLIIDWNPSAN